MTKNRSTKRALLSSVLALFLCFTMLLGTTYAWFTDSVTSGNNIIKSGTLDIVMEYWDGTQWVDAEGKVLEFQKASNSDEEVLWEPGCTYLLPKFRVRNVGSLSAKILIRLNGVTGNEKLLEVIELTNTITNVPETLLTGSQASVFNGLNNATVNPIYGTPDGTILMDWQLMGAGQVAPNSGHTDTTAEFTIAGHMAETAGNEYQGLSIEGISVTVLATQLTYEYDSFGRDYDTASPLPSVSEPVEIPTENITAPIVLEADGSVVTVPADVVNNLSDDVKSLSLNYTDKRVDATTKTVTFGSVDLVDQNGEVVDLTNNTTPITVSIDVPFADGTVLDVFHDDELVSVAIVNGGKVTYTAMHFCAVTLKETSPITVTTADALTNIFPGQVVNLGADITLDNEFVVPAGVTLVGNGKQINGSVVAGGDLTIEGHLKVTSFSASYYNRVITIGEGACLEVTGTGRVTLGYGNTFNITGTIDNAKTADKTKIQPSLIIPGGMSITGGNDATMNITNAYVQIGSTSSKNSAANGTFNFNFDNCIVECTDQFTLAEPTSGMNPTFNINFKDSVVTTGTKFIVAAPNSTVVLDNSTLTAASYFRNSGEVTLKNGSVLTASTIQFGENGGNDGTTIVDNSTLNIVATSAGHALDGKGTGKIVLENGATASVTYYKALTIDCDATSTFTGTEVQ